MFENHFAYADVHFVIDGTEQIDVLSAEQCEPVRDYCAADDSALLKAAGNYSTLELRKGDFAVIFPGEAHRPGISTNGEAGKIRKYVAKVRAECFEAKGLLLI